MCDCCCWIREATRAKLLGDADGGVALAKLITWLGKKHCSPDDWSCHARFEAAKMSTSGQREQ
jgi:hypothetical protein